MALLKLILKNYFAFQEDGTLRPQRDKEVLGGFGGRLLHCQAPAEHDCITWVIKPLAQRLFSTGEWPLSKKC